MIKQISRPSDKLKLTSFTLILMEFEGRTSLIDVTEPFS